MSAMTRSPHGFSTSCGPEWHERAHCRDLDPDLFFTPILRELALHHCLVHCEVLAQCRRQAFKDRPVDAVQGGIPWNWSGRPFGYPVAALSRCGQCRPAVPPRVVQARPVSCGTQAGYDRHRAMGTDPCTPCRAAHARTRADRRARRRVLLGEEG